MRPSPIAVGSTVIIGIIGAIMIVAPWRGEAPVSDAITASTVLSVPEEEIIQRQDGGVTQLLRGGKARARLEELRAAPKRRVGYLRAELNLMGRGLIPTDHVLVVRHIPAAEIIGRSVTPISYSPQDFQESVNGKEILMWSWDDGDDSTWEGTVSVERHSDGLFATWDLQIDIPTAQGYDVGGWWDIDDYGDDEGSECPEDPGEGCPIEVSLTGPSFDGKDRASVVLISEETGQWNPGVIQLVAWVASNEGRRDRVRGFATCSGAALFGGGGAGIYCAATGAAWLPCAGATAAGGIAGCAGYQLFDYLLGNDP